MPEIQVMRKLVKFRWTFVVAVLFFSTAPLAHLLAQAGLPTGPTLVFDADEKEFKATTNDTMAKFTFYATNVWTNNIVVQEVFPSCHCTVAQMPAEPWILAPGASGAVTAEVDLSGMTEDTVTRTLTFFTSVGERVLNLTVIMPPLSPAPVALQTEAERRAAVTKATVDPTAIFRGECAACHVEKARGLMGKDLFVAACGICHDSPRRAAIVPDLRALKTPTNPDYWKAILAKSKPHSLMPAFADTGGGPLTATQVSSLVDYLDKNIPHQPTVK